MGDDFTWRDGERLIRFGMGVAAEAPRLLEQNGFASFVLLTTERAAASVPDLPDRAAAVVLVPPGKVDEISAELLAKVSRDMPFVALGGGRVVDTAKALAGASGLRCAALPTTLSGAELTPFHRLPAGVDGARMVRPALVIADPELMAGAPLTRLAASAMNALAHAMEALYTPLRGPVTDLAALRAAALIAEGITREPAGREQLALGALLAGWASGATGIAFHHAVCQTIVRTAGTPHAETNAVVLPHSARLMAARVPGAMAQLSEAFGDDIARIAARSGHTRLSTLGVTEEHLPAVVAQALGHPATQNTPDPPGQDELLEMLRAAL